MILTSAIDEDPHLYTDFPMSQFVQSQLQKHPEFSLSNHHKHVAVQTPSEWLRTEKSRREAEIAVRKVLYRALLAPVLDSLNVKTKNAGLPPAHRIGKLNNKFYKSFETFLEAASQKLGVDVLGRLDDCAKEKVIKLDSTPDARRIEVLHALRCILGPACESLLILDRYLWLEENLQADGVDVGLVNLFDQSTSDRNIAIVVEPRTKCML